MTLKEAVKDVLAMMDERIIIRNTVNDDEILRFVEEGSRITRAVMVLKAYAEKDEDLCPPS